MNRIRESFSMLSHTAYFDWWEDCYEGAPHPAVIQYDIDGDGVTGTWCVVIDNHRPACTTREGPAQAADLRLKLSGNDWLELVAGRTTIWSLLSANRVSADGDRSLIGVLDLLGLCGHPVTAQEVAAHERDAWIARTPYFVVPRVLAPGGLSHDKWRHFVARGELRAIVSRVQWRVWADPVVARHAKTLRAILRPLWWRDRLLRILARSPAHFSAVALIGLLVLLTALVLSPWWLFLSLAIAASVLVLGLAYALISISNLRARAVQPVTRLACDDSEFFWFAVQHGLIQIDHTPWGSM